jgi:hypothetical protein
MASGAGVGDWLVIQELLERGDPAFVDALRQFHDAATLAAFAERWSADRRPESRRLLLAYLERPLNAFRHEPLVKRLFKRAEQAGDDEVLARFLVLFDRSIRRVRRTRRHYESRTVPDQEQAEALVQSWKDQGFLSAWSWAIRSGQWYVAGSRSEEVVIVPRNTAMPRGAMEESYWDWNPLTRSQTRFAAPDWVRKLKLDPRSFRGQHELPEPFRQRLERFRLFSVATRHYLRRRAWRYFRKLGRTEPHRYVAAVSEALVRYEDADVLDGLALIDNWGLVHALFHHSPALTARAKGWEPAEGHTLAELAPAPIFERLWAASPRAVFDLVRQARCRPVRRWALHMARRDPAALQAAATLDELFALLAHEDAEVAALAAELLRGAEGLEAIGADRWLALTETSSPSALEVVCELLERHLQPERLALAEAARLAASRRLPVARLGLSWLRTKTPGDESECRALLGLTEAEAESIRPEIVRWARGVLAASPAFRPEWVLEYLDSRHADVRAEGWAWLRDEARVRDEVTVWQRLLESPYDDVRLALVADLEARAARLDPARDEFPALDPELLRLLWASVLLNVHRGGRAKPLVVRQLLRRLERRPDEAPRLLPLLGVALRSVRGPEWRAGLAAAVRLVERQPESEPLVRAAFPELQWA